MGATQKEWGSTSLLMALTDGGDVVEMNDTQGFARPLTSEMLITARHDHL